MMFGRDSARAAIVEPQTTSKAHKTASVRIRKDSGIRISGSSSREYCARRKARQTTLAGCAERSTTHHRFRLRLGALRYAHTLCSDSCSQVFPKPGQSQIGQWVPASLGQRTIQRRIRRPSGFGETGLQLSHGQRSRYGVAKKQPETLLKDHRCKSRVTSACQFASDRS